MGKLKVGAFLNSFAMDFKSAMAKASELGLEAIEFSSIPNEIDVFKPFNDEEAKAIKDEFTKRNMVISSICAEVGGFSIADTEEAKKRVEAVKICIDNAIKLGTNIIQFHIGELEFPEDDIRFIENQSENIVKKATEDVEKTNLINSLKELDAYATPKGVKLATETGPEPGDKLAKFIDELNLPAVNVNFDPANLCMWNWDEVKSVYDLKGKIIHTHAKDGIRDSKDQNFLEKALGDGDVRWNEYLKALEDIGYDGYFIIERECGDNPVNDIAMAAKFLKAQ